MDTASRLACLETLDGYRLAFMDAALWEPFVEQVCRDRNWPCEEITPGLAGTYPTFIVDQQRVVKFFGPLFKGQAAWQVELECGEILKDFPEIPTAKLIATGALADQAGWFYLVFEYVAGTSIGQLYDRVAFEDKLALAGWLGKSLRGLHNIKLPENTSLPKLTERMMQGWTFERMEDGLRGWPEQLAGEVEGYLASHATFAASNSTSVIHADLTRDHLLGTIDGGKWSTLAVIDFGDAMRGNIYYELAALHLDLFGCDRRLLKIFLEAYNLPIGPDFPSIAMTTALMHQFDVLGPVFAAKPEFSEARTLEELAGWLWMYYE